MYCLCSSVILFRSKECPHHFDFEHPQSVSFPESTSPSFTLNLSNRWNFMKMLPNSPTEVTLPPYEATTNNINWPIILPYATDAGNMAIASLTFILFASLRHPW